MKSHKLLSSKRVSITDNNTGFRKDIEVRTFRMPNGLVDRQFLDAGQDSVQVFALTKGDNRVITVEQYRSGPNKVVCELPGGGIKPGELDIDAAGRELLEETGFEAKSLTPMFVQNYGPYDLGKRHGFLAEDCVKSTEGQNLDPNEFISVKLWDLDEFVKKILTGGPDQSIRGWDLAVFALLKSGRNPLQ